MGTNLGQALYPVIMGAGWGDALNDLIWWVPFFIILWAAYRNAKELIPSQQM
jgi:hypothetical protein